MRTILRGGTVFDGTGTDPYPADVVLDGSVITSVGSGPEFQPGDRVIDLSGHTVLPGLIDCHVHAVFSGVDTLALMQEPFSYQFYAAQRNLQRTLDIGVTTVRDAGGADLGMKQATDEGLIDGPDLQTAVTVLSQTGGHADGWTVHGDLHRLLVEHPGRPDTVVDGPDEMRKRVRQLARAGADVIKICTSGGVLSPRDDPRHPQFGPAELEACVATAATFGLSVMAHAQGKPGIINALRAGVRSIEHGIYADDECFDLMRETGAWLVPTLLAPVALIRAIDAGAKLPVAIEAKARAVVDIHASAIAAAVGAGVKIAMGTDSGVFAHGMNLEELVLMQRSGMSPGAVLAAATSSAADLLGLADRGRLAPGLRADLAVVKGDPFDLPGLQRNLTHVFKAGALVRAADGSTARRPAHHR
ncbi:metal-dependent hydrolase family protein [Nakamurella lactea]|uniref:metal-dependent hydrolase family protein n=1 Tax=Nakamurella lactea TaxID=459515 RepID=UPI00040C99D3|nr:amidohydrolase family protein [Nakamurella lactea]